MRFSSVCCRTPTQCAWRWAASCGISVAFLSGRGWDVHRASEVRISSTGTPWWPGPPSAGKDGSSAAECIKKSLRLIKPGAEKSQFSTSFLDLRDCPRNSRNETHRTSNDSNDFDFMKWPTLSYYPFSKPFLLGQYVTLLAGSTGSGLHLAGLQGWHLQYLDFNLRCSPRLDMARHGSTWLDMARHANTPNTLQGLVRSVLPEVLMSRM